MFADSVSLICADQRTDGSANQRLITSARQTKPRRPVACLVPHGFIPLISRFHFTINLWSPDET
jgi:hypothetical protein